VAKAPPAGYGVVRRAEGWVLLKRGG